MLNLARHRAAVSLALALGLAGIGGGCERDGLEAGASALTVPMAIVDHQESAAAIANPERGYYVRLDLLSPWQAAAVAAAGDRLALAIVKLDAYRDRPLDDELIAQLWDGLAAVRAAGIKVILRFRYNAGYTDDAPREVVLGHIAQLEPLLAGNEDVIAVMQAGFIGAWGEWHHSTNGLDNDADRALILGALLDALPASRSVQVRTPMQKDAIAPGGPLDAESAWDGSHRARIGHHNDCFLATDDDYGTYDEPIDAWRDYVAVESAYAPIGGETCQLNAPRTDCDNAVAELAMLGFSYLNDEFDLEVLEHWDDDGCGEEIERRLGYRLAAGRVKHNLMVAPGGELDLSIEIDNHGFAAPFNERAAYVVLNRLGQRYVAELVGRDPRTWRPGTTTLAARFRIPADAPLGRYAVGLWLPDAAPTLAADPRYAIRLANDGVWTDAGINVLSKVVVTPAASGPVDLTATAFEEL